MGDGEIFYTMKDKTERKTYRIVFHMPDEGQNRKGNISNSLSYVG